MFLQPVSKSKNGGLIGQAAKLFQLGKLPVQRGVKERLFHGGVRQRTPLLHKVDAQHSHQRKGRPASLAFGVVGGNEFDQCSPWHHLIHLIQEHLLAGYLGAEIEVQGGLFHAMYFIAKVMFFQHIFE